MLLQVGRAVRGRGVIRDHDFAVFREGFQRRRFSGSARPQHLVARALHAEGQTHHQLAAQRGIGNADRPFRRTDPGRRLQAQMERVQLLGSDREGLPEIPQDRCAGGGFVRCRGVDFHDCVLEIVLNGRRF